MKRLLMIAVVPVLMLAGSVRANELSLDPVMMTEAKAVSHADSSAASSDANELQLTDESGKATDACFYRSYGYGCGYYGGFSGYRSYSWCYPTTYCYTSYYCHPYSCWSYPCGHWCYY